MKYINKSIVYLFYNFFIILKIKVALISWLCHSPFAKNQNPNDTVYRMETIWALVI